MLELALAIKGKVDGSLSESLRKASGSMEDLARKAVKLEGINRNANAFKNVSQAVQDMQRRLEQANSTLDQAKAKLDQTGGSSAKVRRAAKRAVQQAATNVRQLSAALSDEEAKLQGIKQNLEAAGFSTDKFAASQANLEKTIAANNKVLDYRRANAAARTKRDAASQNLANANINMQAGLDFGKTLIAPLVEATEKAIAFESAMADVRKVVDFDTPQQFKEMSNDVLALSQRLPMAANDIAKIVAAGGQSGIARDELMGFAEAAVKMGIAFDVTADQAGDMMAKWRTAFKMNQSEVVSLADKINYLGNTTAASAPLISDVVTRIGPLGEIGGVASGEIAALGASMIGTGVQSDVAATGIKNLILGMVAGEGATKSQAAAFDKLGMSATDVARRMQVDAKGAILDVMKALKALPKEEQAVTLSDLFGNESIGAISPLLSNLDALADNFQKVGDASQYAGSMEQEYEARSATTENKIQLMKNAVTALGISIGNALLPAVGAVADAVGPIVQSIGAWASRNQALVATLAAIAAAVAGVVFGFLGLSLAVALVTFMSAQMQVLRTSVFAVRVQIMLLSAAQAAATASTTALAGASTLLGTVMNGVRHPVKALQAALMLLRGGTVSAAAGLASMGGKAFTALRAIPTLISGAVSALPGIMAGLATVGLPVLVVLGAIIGVIALVVANFEQIKATATIVFNHISATVGAWVAYLQATFQGALATITGVWNSITGQTMASSQIIGAIINNIGFVIGAAFDVAAGIVGTAISLIINMIAAMAQLIGGFINIVVGLLTGDWQRAWQGAAQVFNGLFDGVIGTFKTIADGVSNIFDTLMGKADEAQQKAEAAKSAAGAGAGADDADSYAAAANAQEVAAATSEAASSAQAFSGNMQQAGSNTQAASGSIQEMQSLLSQTPAVVQTAFSGMGDQSAMAAQAVTANLQQIPMETQATFQQIPAQAGAALQEIPAQTQGAFDQLQPMAQASVDAVAAEYGQLAAKCQPGGDAFVQAANQWGQSAYESIAQWAGEMAGVVVERLSSAWSQISSQFSAGLNVNVTTTNTVVTKEVKESVDSNARGGIYPRGEFLTTFAERSAEAAIPLDGSGRALSLWQRAGRILGVLPTQTQAAGQSLAPRFSALSIRPQAPAKAKTPVVMAPPVRNTAVNLEFKPSITVEGSADSSVVELINQALREQAKQFRAALPNMLREIRANDRRLSYE